LLFGFACRLVQYTDDVHSVVLPRVGAVHIYRFGVDVR
jgi:hypothetical protein